MADMPWKEAIIRTLREHGAAMTRTEIAETIVEKGFRKSVGATPAHTVAAYVSTSIANEGSKSPFLKVDRGVYALRELAAAQGRTAGRTTRDDVEEETAAIQAFGVYWSRELVHWSRNPKLLGQQQVGAKAVNMADQIGIYLLYDGREVVYVGRSIDRPFGQRLYEHSQDRLRARWNRFSWFGLKGVNDEGKLSEPSTSVTGEAFIRALEAVLIEAVEPRQNRKRGDDFSGIEYMQAADPKLKELEKLSVLEELVAKVKLQD